MKINETSIFIFIAALALGLLVSLNINFNRKPSAPLLSAQQYKDAYNLKQKLLKDISNIKEQYNNNHTKLLKYKYSDSSSSKILKEINTELSNNKLFLGNTEVSGEGIMITLDDGPLIFDDTIESQLKNWERLVHDSDIRLTVKNLRDAGAKAIAVNGVRVISTSSFICAGEFIMVDGVKLGAPYYIDAIGSKDVLMNYMTGGEGYLKYLEYFREVDVTFEKSDYIKIPPCIGEIKYKYMVEVDG